VIYFVEEPIKKSVT